MNRASVIAAVLIVLVMALATACGTVAAVVEPTPAPTSTLVPVKFAAMVDIFPTREHVDLDFDEALASQGRELFLGKGTCLTCHTIQGTAEGLLGPELTFIGADAATRREGYTAREYITESILDSEAFIAQGVERAKEGLMTTILIQGLNLTDDEVKALVEFLYSQQ